MVAAAAARIGVPAVEAVDSVAEALELALRRAEPEDLVLVTGSLYVVGAARLALGVRRRRAERAPGPAGVGRAGTARPAARGPVSL